MITDLILDLVAGLVSFLVSLLPPWQLDIPGISELGSHLSRYDQWVPVTEVRQQVTIVISLFGVLVVFKLAVKLFDWITNVIP